jgi:hypothetical protein
VGCAVALVASAHDAHAEDVHAHGHDDDDGQAASTPAPSTQASGATTTSSTGSTVTYVGPTPDYVALDYNANRVEGETFPYEEGDPIPAGFKLRTSPNGNLIFAGAISGGTLWAISTITAIALDRQTDEKIEDGNGGSRRDPEFDDNYWPMFIPVAGPFVAIDTSDATGTGAAILALDGAFQVGALALFIAGFIAEDEELVRKKPAIAIEPMLSPGSAGIGVKGAF